MPLQLCKILTRIWVRIVGMSFSRKEKLSLVVKRLEQESSSRVKTSIDHSKEKTKKKLTKKSTSIEEHSKEQIEEQKTTNVESLQTISLPGFTRNPHSTFEHQPILFFRSSFFIVVLDGESILPSVLLSNVRLFWTRCPVWSLVFSECFFCSASISFCTWN